MDRSQAAFPPMGGNRHESLPSSPSPFATALKFPPLGELQPGTKGCLINRSAGYAMLVITLLSLLIAVPLFSSKTSPSYSSNTSGWKMQLTRATSVTFFLAAALSFNAYYVATLGSGVSLYSGLFHVSTVSMAIEFFIFIVGGLILLS